MSYSFTVTGSTKVEAREKAASALIEVTKQQPAHNKEFQAVLENLHNAVSVLAYDPAQDVRIQCHGSLTWGNDPEQIIGVCIAATAWLVPKDAA